MTLEFNEFQGPFEGLLKDLPTHTLKDTPYTASQVYMETLFYFFIFQQVIKGIHNNVTGIHIIAAKTSNQ